MRACLHCGQPATQNETRCARCGARLDAESPGSWERTGLGGGAPPEAPPRLPDIEEEEPPPDWKNEVNRKLAAYRERQSMVRAEESPVASVSQQSPPGGGFYRPGVDKQAAERLARLAAEIDAPSLDAEGNLSETTTRRRTAADWRRVERTSAEPSREPIPAPLPPMAETPPSAAAYAEPVDFRETPTAVPVAPLSKRIMAGLFDLSLVLLALGLFVGLVWGVEPDLFLQADSLRIIGGAFFLLICFYWIFYVAFLGETAGMSWMGLRVLNLDGDAPTPRQLRTRAFGTILSTLAAGLGFAWAALDIERLSWHDRMSKTFVARAAEAPIVSSSSHKDSGQFARAF